MPGRPFAVGGPSKKTHGVPPLFFSSVSSNSPSSSQRASSSRSSSSAGRSEGSIPKDIVSPPVAVIASHPLEHTAHDLAQLRLGGIRHGDDLFHGRRRERVGETRIGDDRQSQ